MAADQTQVVGRLAPQIGDLSVGVRIRLARQSASLSIRELARRLGISTDSLSDYEKDRTDPPSRILAGIAQETHCTADWLLFGATRAKLNGRSPRSLNVLPRPASLGDPRPTPDRPILAPVR